MGVATLIIRIFAAFGAAVANTSIKLATFDGASGTTFKFTELNDPVMGGKSSGTWNVDMAGKFGIFDGEVVDVPSLSAPGFIKAAADGTFPDVSSAADGELVLMVRTSTPEFAGFRVSFVSGAVSPAYACSGGGSIPFSRGCFKAKFSAPAGENFVAVRIPFSSFSDKWSPATGEQSTTCAEDKTVCPTADKLKAIKRVEVWAEGADGKVHLEIQSIAAETGSTIEPLQMEALPEVKLATFDGSDGTTFKWAALVDPVMGGRSTGTWTLNDAGQYGVLDGEVVDVPSLAAPGFITAYSQGKFADASSALDGSLILTVRSSTPEYKGFRVSFASGTLAPQYACAGGGSIPLSGGCYKSQAFSVPAGNEFVAIKIPFNSFSDMWSPSTGAQTKTCAEDKSVCPTAEKLKGIKRLEIWAEGARGKVHIEVKSISAQPEIQFAAVVV